MFLLINKPKGITSHDVIQKLRKISNEKRIGHAGTLDPNATGLLIVAIGRKSTKDLWEKFGKLDKTYLAEITLGEERETDDVSGKLIIKNQINKVFEESDIQKVITGFVGEQMQIPPIYSAIKIKGKKAYELARKGNDIELKPRKVIIHSLKLLNYTYPILNIQIKVSSGTYIRALARDFGRMLGCGAYLSNLARTEIGRYHLKNAAEISDLEQNGISDKASYLIKN